MHKSCDVLVIGSGLAGLSTALKLADTCKVILVTKSQLSSGSSAMAQGGIAAVQATSDSYSSHIEDTIKAGAGLSDREVVRQMVEQAPARIQDLKDWGVHFDLDTDGEHPHLTLEGGHSHRRVLHIQDHSGQSIHAAVLEKVLAHKNIEILSKHVSIDLITNKKMTPRPDGRTQCLGAYILNMKTEEVVAISAKYTVLATGGAGKTYLYTSNWEGATGDGIAMAYRAGCRIANMEFMQFHPTVLYHAESRNFLISEAVRGEGGELINHKGEAFAKDKHPLGSLAPRDIVARIIDEEMKKTAAKCVYLDISKRSPDFIESHFPTILQKCLEYGIDMRKQAIPVVPAAHYLCGGVLTNIYAETDVLGLLAVGETACTGLHGANRLASNSLLECLVTSHNAAELILKNKNSIEDSPENIPAWVTSTKQDSDEMVVISHLWDEIRNLMWNYVGIVRSDKRLKRAQQRLELIHHEVHEYYWDFKIHRDIIELRNLAIVAKLSVECALKRKESRGIHFNIDYPFLKEGPAENTIIDSVLMS